MARTQQHWDPEVANVVRGLWFEGKSGSDIVIILEAEFGFVVTRNAVMGKVRKLGLFGKRRSVQAWPRMAGRAA